MSIGQLMLWEKTGGSSGVWKREPYALSNSDLRTSGSRPRPRAISRELLSEGP